MNGARFDEITSRYRRLRVAIVGDFCLDRYLEIDPKRAEASIETGLEVYNVVNVRSQPGAAGTILNNLVALGVAEVFAVGFCGDDGEGFELRRALAARPGVRLDYFIRTKDRRTFTYCKPLIIMPGRPPRELNRLDSKNWSPTPADVQDQVIAAVKKASSHVDAVILMDQVDVPETGVITAQLLREIGAVAQARPELLMIADSRRSLRGYPSVCLKMNAAELALLAQIGGDDMHVGDIEHAKTMARQLAATHGRPVFITMAERGIVGAAPGLETVHVPALPTRGEIDVVGAGDAVTANLIAALGGGASISEALELAMGAASVVIHQLGTTGTASVAEIGHALGITPRS